MFPGVPRLFNRLYGVIKGKLSAATGCRGWLLNHALEAKLANLQRTG